jgi:hypothetical protein
MKLNVTPLSEERGPEGGVIGAEMWLTSPLVTCHLLTRRPLLCASGHNAASLMLALRVSKLL